MYLIIITILLLGSIAFGFLSRESEVCRLKLLLLYFFSYLCFTIICGFTYSAYLVLPSLNFIFSINTLLNIIPLFIYLFICYLLYTVYYKSNNVFNKNTKKNFCSLFLLNPFASNNNILKEDVSIFSSYNLKCWIVSNIFIMVFIIVISYINSFYLVPAVKISPNYIQLGFLAFGLVLLLIYKSKIFAFFNKINLFNKFLLFLYIFSVRFIMIYVAREYLCLFDSELSEFVLLILTTESFFFLFKPLLYEYLGLFSSILVNWLTGLNINFKSLCGFIPNCYVKQSIISFISYKYINIRMKPFCTRIIGANKFPLSIELGVLSIVNKPYFPSFFQPLSLPFVCSSVSTIMLANIFKSRVLSTIFADSLSTYITTGKITRGLEIVLDLISNNKSKFNYPMSSHTDLSGEFKSDSYQEDCTSIIIKDSYNSICMDIKRLYLSSFVKSLDSIQLLERYVNIGSISLRSSISIYSYMFLCAIFYSLPVGVLAIGETYYIADKPWVLSTALTSNCINGFQSTLSMEKMCTRTSTSISTSISTITSISIITSVVSITNTIDRSLSSINLPTVTKTISTILPTVTAECPQSAKSVNLGSKGIHLLVCVVILIISITIHYLWGTSSTESTSSVVETNSKKKNKKKNISIKKENNKKIKAFIKYLKEDFKRDFKGWLLIFNIVIQALLIGLIVNIYTGFAGLA